MYRAELSTDDNVKYVSMRVSYFPFGGVSYEIGLFNSQYDMIRDLQDGYGISSDFTLKLFYGGDKLLVSPNLPTDSDLANLDDWQMYRNGAFLKVKLP